MAKKEVVLEAEQEEELFELTIEEEVEELYDEVEELRDELETLKLIVDKLIEKSIRDEAKINGLADLLAEKKILGIHDIEEAAQEHEMMLLTQFRA
jgi:hypothetical protein